MLERFIRTEGQLPEGIHVVGRWHRVDGSGGLMVIEADSMVPVTELAFTWNDLLFLEVEPVVLDHELTHVIEKIRKSREK